jgi:isoleucyl-tRNA synthetase
LVRDMDLARAVCSAALGIRKAKDLRTRLPLASLTVAGAEVDRLEPYFDLIREEVNVKKVAVSRDLDALGSFALKVNAALVGPRLGQDMKKVMAAAKQGKWKARDDGTLDVDGIALRADEFELRLQPKEGVASQPLPGNKVIVALDTVVTPELEREGLARDLVRAIQQARKDAGLRVSDHVRLNLKLTPVLAAAATAHAEWIGAQTLADTITRGDGSGVHVATADFDGGESATIGVSKA